MCSDYICYSFQYFDSIPDGFTLSIPILSCPHCFLHVGVKELTVSVSESVSNPISAFPSICPISLGVASIYVAEELEIRSYI